MITHADARRCVALLVHGDARVQDRARAVLCAFIEQYTRDTWTACILWLMEEYLAESSRVSN